MVDVYKEEKGHKCGTVELEPFEFVDDIADSNRNKYDAQISDKVIIGVQELKKLKFSFEKCKVLNPVRVHYLLRIRHLT